MLQARTDERTLLTSASNGTPVLRLLQELPGMVDIVWAIRARVDLGRDPVRVLFASAERRSGNSVLAAATAIALVRHARVPVCLVEANIEHPSLASYLGLRNVGLSDALDGRCELEDCVQSPHGCPGLYVLPAGTPRKPMSGEFATERMRSMLAMLGALGRYVVLDAPRILDHLESRVLLQQVDGALLVLRAGSTRADAAQRAHRILLDSGAPLLGSIFNAYGTPRAFSRTEPYQLSESEIGHVAPAHAPVEQPDFVLQPKLVSGNGEHPTNGDVAGERSHGHTGEVGRVAPFVSSADSEEAHRREVDVLERRIAKLNALLASTEAELRQMAEAKNIETGVASIYRDVQGLSPEEQAVAFKKDLMREIFQANFELQHATQRRS